MKRRCLTLAAVVLWMMLLSIMAFAEDVQVELGSDGKPAAASGTGWTWEAEGASIRLNEGNVFTFTGGSFTGTVLNYGTIANGDFSGTVNNNSGSLITGGTFAGEVYNNSGGTISGGTFGGGVYNNNGASIVGGTFDNAVYNGGSITDSTLNGMVYNNVGGTISGCTLSGEIYNYGGTVSDNVSAQTGVTMQLTGLASSETVESESGATTFTLLPNSGYALPESITITRDETALVAGTDYTYDPATGAVSINAEAVTDTLVVEAAGIRATYSIAVNPSTLDFGSAIKGYAQPDAQTVTVTNDGNQLVTLWPPQAGAYTFGDLSATELAPGESATFTAVPKWGLTADTYSQALTVFGSENAKATIVIAFEVTQAPAAETEETEESASESSSEPEAEQSAAESSSEPETEQSAAEPSSEPETEQSAAEPSSEPETEQSAAESSSEPETEQSAAESSSEPETEQSAAEPSSEPETEQSAAESTPTDYAIVQGSGSTWSSNSASGIAMTTNANSSNLKEVRVDGVLLRLGTDYTLRTSGVTLKPTYLVLLAPGQHTLTMNYNDGGQATAAFTIQGSGTTAGGSDSTYVILAQPGEGGRISPFGQVEVAAGSSKTFLITPTHDHVIADLIVDGKSVGALGTYTFDDVQSTHTIEAVFAPKNAISIAKAE